MEYVTFVSRGQTWRLYRGIGTAGALLAERADAPTLLDLSAARAPLLWVCGHGGDQAAVIQRVTLPDLRSEPIAWDGGRAGAVASSPDGQRAVVAELPDQPDGQPRLRLWDAGAWHTVTARIVPDISSKLAWLDGSRIVCEGQDRQLAVLDLDTGAVEVGPPGCCPAAAGDRREWYAIADGRVLRFPFAQPFNDPPAPLDSFDFGHVTTLHVTYDGQVGTWTEPRLLYQSKGYLQERGHRRRRFKELDDGIGAVIGPVALGVS